jgi:hypothetical protein
MRPPLRRDLRYACVLNAELFAQQGTRFVESVVLRRESHPRIDAIGGPGARVYNGVMGQCDRMEYRRLNAVLPASGRWIRGVCGLLGIVTSENEFCKNPTSKDTINTIYSESYDLIGGHKHSLDQGSSLCCSFYLKVRV